MAAKMTSELRKKFEEARSYLHAAGWEQVCSVMDDGNKSGRIDFGTLYAKPIPRAKSTDPHKSREFWMNYKTVEQTALFIDIAKTLDECPDADLLPIIQRHIK